MKNKPPLDLAISPPSPFPIMWTTGTPAPRIEPSRTAAARLSTARAHVHALVPWPVGAVEQRDIAAYAEAVGCAR